MPAASRGVALRGAGGIVSRQRHAVDRRAAVRPPGRVASRGGGALRQSAIVSPEEKERASTGSARTELGSRPGGSPEGCDGTRRKAPIWLLRRLAPKSPN